MTLDLDDQISGCLFAGALGDSIGAHFENSNQPDFAIPKSLHITDDTQLTIATCEAIIDSSCVSADLVAARMTAWFRERRISGIGASTLKSLIELEAGGHWAMVGATGERSAGNGAAMRIAPLAFFLNPNDDSDRTTIRDVCRITHRNDEAYLGALAVVYSINRGNLEHGLIRFLIQALPDSRVRDRFVEIRDNDLTAEKLAKRHPPTGYVVDSVPLSILAAIESIDFMNSVKSIVEFGGDVDTVASIYGNIFGAVNGVSSLPMQIVQEINEFELVSSTAENLARLASI